MDFYMRYYTRTMDLNMQPETLPHKENRIDLDTAPSRSLGSCRCHGLRLNFTRTSGGCRNSC